MGRGEQGQGEWVWVWVWEILISEAWAVRGIAGSTAQGERVDTADGGGVLRCGKGNRNANQQAGRGWGGRRARL